MGDRPNIVLIQVDQMIATAMSCAGSSLVATPNLDALAAHGTRFANAQCQIPICLPSRISMMSGQYASTHGQFGFEGECRPGTPWLPIELQESGYRTAACGKFHTHSIGSDRWGFEFAAGTIPEDDMLFAGRGVSYRDYCLERDVPWPTDQMHCANPYGEPQQRLSSHATGRARRYREAALSDVPVEHSLETWTTNHAIEWLERNAGAGSGRPLFLWLTYDRPHFPTTLPEPWYSRALEKRQKIGAIADPLPPEEMLVEWPAVWQNYYARGASVIGYGAEEFTHVLATYYTLIEWIDAEIGQVVARIHDLGLAENSAVIFTADHGDEAGFQGFYDKGRNVSSDAITRVPLIVVAPGGLHMPQLGRVFTSPVELIDLYSTVREWAGLSPAGEGKSLAPLLAGGELDPHRPVFSEFWFARMVVQDQWRLVFDLQDESRSLLLAAPASDGALNLLSDSTNRYRDPSCKRTRVALKRVLYQFLCERPVPPRYPAVDGQRFSEAELDQAIRERAAQIPVISRLPWLIMEHYAE